MTLPRLLLLTDRTQLPQGRTLTDQIARAVDAGVRAVVLRERDLAPADRSQLADDIAALLHDVGGVLIAASPGIAAASGLHLRSADALPPQPPTLLGRSCHTDADLARARADRVDYAVLGPVAPSESKPGYGPTLGRAGLERMLADHTGPPVYALGGVTPDNVAAWLDAGAYGVAVMGPLMRSADPESLARGLLAAL